MILFFIVRLYYCVLIIARTLSHVTQYTAQYAEVICLLFAVTESLALKKFQRPQNVARFLFFYSCVF